MLIAPVPVTLIKTLSRVTPELTRIVFAPTIFTGVVEENVLPATIAPDALPLRAVYWYCCVVLS